MTEAVAQLHDVRFVHGDIARRNFLVDDVGNVFITDLGKGHWLSKRKVKRMSVEQYSKRL